MWFQLASAALGMWLIAAPAVLGYEAPAASYDRILGPTVAAVALIAAFEITRGVRWVNLPAGLALATLPWVIGYDLLPHINSTVVGITVALLSVPRGRIKRQVGGGWRSLAK